MEWEHLVGGVEDEIFLELGDQLTEVLGGWEILSTQAEHVP